MGENVTGRIFEIQRFSIHDGPGIRTTVFLKGCPLRCQWCHNPEGIEKARQVSFMPDKCIGCGYCFRTCRSGAHKMAGDKHVLDRTMCRICGDCTKECCSRALELVGRDITVKDALDEVMRDAAFYQNSGGGITLSGGEPLMQIEFTRGLLEAAKAVNLHTAVETCGFAAFALIESIRAHVDLFLYDIKETDTDRHKEYCGVPNDVILENLRRLHDSGASILVRMPIVPGMNDREDHFQAIAKLSQALPRLLGFEVMPYHALGTSKLRRFDRDEGPLRGIKGPSAETVGSWIARLRALGVRVRNDEE